MDSNNESIQIKTEVLALGNPFDDYKDKVNYDYIIEAKMKYKFKGGNEEQKLDATDKIIENIEKLISDEDYNKMCFDDVELGRVYPRLDEIDDTLDITFGIRNSSFNISLLFKNTFNSFSIYSKIFG